jgi:catechol 2,3-dioxygenase-like lactoylglutathione lyase family enzyme
VATSLEKTYEVGGIRMARPFRALRLGHFGFNYTDSAAALRFYADLLGLAISDQEDFAPVLKVADKNPKERIGYFLRIGPDHHNFVLFPYECFALSGRPMKPGWETISHIAWQVGTLREVTEARDWVRERQMPVIRQGRDACGSNYQFYFNDPDSFPNELYYGMDQIGWDGASKPFAMIDFSGVPLPDGPIEGDFPDVVAALRRVDPRDGMHVRDFGPARYDVSGVMLPRPFRVVRGGPIRLFVKDVAAATAFYRDTIGLGVTETVPYDGHECVFLRANTEHHAVALYPESLRDALGFEAGSKLMSYGLQLGSYRQLLDAIAFLEDHGVRIAYRPPELFPGIDYSAFAIDPDGHAIQLYYYMEQVGWDGRPRPASARRQVDNARWPEALDALDDTFLGPVFQGPIG